MQWLYWVFVVTKYLLSHNHGDFEGLGVHHLNQKLSRLGIKLAIGVRLLGKAFKEMLEYFSVEVIAQIACYP